MKVLIDTCVVIDFLQSREPFADDAKEIFLAAAASTELFKGYITAKSATDIYYLIHRCTHNDKETRIKLNSLLSIVGVLDTTDSDIQKALSSDTHDFEDAVMIETAIRTSVDCIITRNQKDYSGSPVPVLSPSETIQRLLNQ